jgi:hypothetical protein
MRGEKEQFIKHCDEISRILVHKLEKLKQETEEFFERQI